MIPTGTSEAATQLSTIMGKHFEKMG